MITVVGVDSSLTASGYAIVREDGTVLSSGVIKSKPMGDKPIDETRRILKITEACLQKIDEYLPVTNPDLIVIEGLAFLARNTTALVQLSGLNYLIRTCLTELQWPFCIIQPTSLKKFITGSGKGDKDMMLLKVFKNYGFEALDNNANDAYALAVCGLALLGKPLIKMTQPQQEVLTLLKKQL